MRLIAAMFSLLVLAVPAQADLTDQALTLINQQRAAKGCAALSPNAALQAAAEVHARDMSRNDFFSHTGSNGSNITQRFRKAGYPGGTLAENIAGGPKTAAAVVDMWMNSPPHRKNMLNCKHKSTGIAVVYDPKDQPMKGASAAFKYYWVLTLGAD